MANKVLLKKSSVASKVPQTSDLDYGELALNYTDEKLYFKNASNIVKYFSTSATASSGGKITVSATAPANPSAADQWLDSNTGIKYTYIDDGDSSQWVELESLVTVNTGSAYSNEYVLTGTTTNAIETELFINGVSNYRIPISNNTAVMYTVDIACRRTDSGTEYGAFTLKSLVSRTGAGTVDVGNVYEIVVARSDINFNVDARANNANSGLSIYVTGVAGKTIQWRAVVLTVSV